MGQIYEGDIVNHYYNNFFKLPYTHGFTTYDDGKTEYYMGCRPYMAYFYNIKAFCSRLCCEDRPCWDDDLYQSNKYDCGRGSCHLCMRCWLDNKYYWCQHVHNKLLLPELAHDFTPFEERPKFI